MSCRSNRMHVISGFSSRLLRCVLLVAVLVSAIVANAASYETPAPVLRIAYTEFPPIEYRDASGQPAGWYIDLTRRVVREAGYTPEFLYLPISRVYLYLKNGTVDLWPGLTKIPSLQGEVLESWVSPFAAQLSAWYLDTLPPVTDFNDLKGHSVIVIGGYTYGGLIDWLNAEASIRVTEAPNHRAAMDMLKRGRGDYVLDYRQPVRQILNEPGDESIQETELRSRNAAWLFSLARPRAAILREEFDDAYLRLLERGEVPELPAAGSAYVIPGFPEAYR